VLLAAATLAQLHGQVRAIHFHHRTGGRAVCCRRHDAVVGRTGAERERPARRNLHRALRETSLSFCVSRCSSRTCLGKVIPLNSKSLREGEGGGEG
jgi:hypothetical protein